MDYGSYLKWNSKIRIQKVKNYFLKLKKLHTLNNLKVSWFFSSIMSFVTENASYNLYNQIITKIKTY